MLMYEDIFEFNPKNAMENSRKVELISIVAPLIKFLWILIILIYTT